MRRSTTLRGISGLAPLKSFSDLAAIRDWLDGRGAPVLTTAKIKLLTRCNLDCSFCPWRVSANAPADILTLDDLRAPLRDMRDLGLRGIHFSGGEPLIHPELVDIVRYCREIGISHVSLTTNASVATPLLATRLFEAGLTSVNASVDGEDAALHGRTPQVFRRTLEGIAHLLSARDRSGESRPKVRINIVVARTNLLGIPALVEEFVALRVNGVHLIPIQERPELFLSAKEIAWFRAQVWPVFRKYFDPDGHQRDPFADSGAIQGEYVREFYRTHVCYIPWVHTFVRANGDVHVCCQRQIRDAPLGNIRRASIHDILTGVAYTAERSRFDRFACRICNMFTTFNLELAEHLNEHTPPKEAVNG